jgi:hypothetical protein
MGGGTRRARFHRSQILWIEKLENNQEPGLHGLQWAILILDVQGGLLRLIIAHISDLHLREDDGFTARATAIGNAIVSVDIAVHDFIICITGDIAGSALPTEYSTALRFFRAVESAIKAHCKEARIHFAIVPGNHDCYLPESSIALRNLLVGGLSKAIGTNHLDQELLNQVLMPQSSFFDFDQTLCGRDVPVGDGKVARTAVVNIGPYRIQLNLYNTALTSKRTEEQGQLVIPMQACKENITLHPADLAIALMHHGYGWIEADNAVEFRRHVEGVSDVVFMGHQHFEHGYLKSDLTGAQTLYLESPALNDPTAKTENGFATFLYDFESTEYSLIAHRWKVTHYDKELISEPSTIVRHPQGRRGFDITEQFQTFLRDSGIGLTHSRKSRVILSDLFVFPDLSLGKWQRGPRQREVLSENVPEYIASAKHVLFEGSSRIGKTAFAKMCYAHLFRRGEVVPLWIAGSSITSGDISKLPERLRLEFGRQYEPSLFGDYDQLNLERRAVIIDDWHKVKLNSRSRSELLQYVCDYFGRVFLFSDAVFLLEQMAEKSEEQQLLMQFDRATVLQLGHVTRAELIKKWVALGREFTHDAKDADREVDEVDKVLTSLVGKNTLPRLPFVILSLLEAYDQKKTSTPEAGSFGYLYEVLITTAIAATAKSPADIDTKYTILSRIAYFMFRAGSSVIAPDDLGRVIDEYRVAYGMKMEVSQLTRDLVSARVMAECEGNYGFTYSYYLEYFAARYYKDQIQSGGEAALQAIDEVKELVSYVSNEQFANVVMFVEYFTKNPEVLSDIVEKANAVLRNLAPADLSTDVEFVNSLYSQAPVVSMPDEDVEGHRHEQRQALDTVERNSPDDRSTIKVRYDEAVADAQQFDIAYRYVQLLGQILRNFPGSLKAESKITVASAAYLLGLRTLSKFLSILREATAYYRELVTDALSDEPQDGEKKSIRQVEKQANENVVYMTRISALSVIKGISMNVGAAELSETYSKALSDLKYTNAARLVDLSIKLDHYDSFPETQIEAMHRDLKDNLFAHNILTDLVVIHFTLFRTSFRVRQKIGNLLSFKPTTPGMVSTRPKLKKEKE